MELSGCVRLFGMVEAHGLRMCREWGLVVVENEKVNRNQISKKFVCSAEVLRNGMKFLGGSGQGMEEAALEKYEREEEHQAKRFEPISGSSIAGGF